MANTTWNPSDKTSGVALSGGNLIATLSTPSNQGVRAVDRQVSGKYYWEITTSSTVQNIAIGVTNGAATISSIVTSGSPVSASAGCAFVNNNGTVIIDGAAINSALGTLTVGTIVCVALDLDNRRLWFRYGAAGNWNAGVSNNPATNVGGHAIPFGSTLAAYPLAVVSSAGTPNPVQTANFGDSAFSGTVPSGFTSGFPIGAPANIAVATQIAAEQWGSPSPAAQITQLALEEWTSVNAISGRAIVTQLAVEQWARAPSAATGRKRRRVSVAT